MTALLEVEEVEEVVEVVEELVVLDVVKNEVGKKMTDVLVLDELDVVVLVVLEVVVEVVVPELEVELVLEVEEEEVEVSATPSTMWSLQLTVSFAAKARNTSRQRAIFGDLEYPRDLLIFLPARPFLAWDACGSGLLSARAIFVSLVVCPEDY